MVLLLSSESLLRMINFYFLRLKEKGNKLKRSRKERIIKETRNERLIVDSPYVDFAKKRNLQR